MVKILFDHIPKCGGTSVYDFLTELYGENVVARHLGGHASTFFATGLFGRYQVVAGHFNGQIFQQAIPDLKYITVIRDPVETVVSSYFYLRNVSLDKGELVQKARALSLKDFVEILGPDSLTRHFAGSSGAGDPERDLLIRAKRNLGLYDVVGITENMPRFFERVSELSGRPRPDSVFRARTNKRKPRLNEIDLETISYIKEKQPLGIELYEFAKELSEKPNSGTVGRERDAFLATTYNLWVDRTPDVQGISIDLVSLNGKSKKTVGVTHRDRVKLRFRASSKAGRDIRTRFQFALRYSSTAIVATWSYPDTVMLKDGQTEYFEVSFRLPFYAGFYELDVSAGSGPVVNRTVHCEKHAMASFFVRPGSISDGTGFVFADWSMQPFNGGLSISLPSWRERLLAHPGGRRLVKLLRGK